MTKTVSTMILRQVFIKSPKTAKSVRMYRLGAASRGSSKAGSLRKKLMGSNMMDILEGPKREGV